MKFIGIIPARYDSSRFPGKPLQMISGKSMIQRVFEQCRASEKLSEVIVATDDKRIADHMQQFGGKYVLTSANHKCGTERCNEAIKILNNKDGFFSDNDVVINIQGDEPIISPLQIDLVAGCFNKPDTSIATLVKKINCQQEIFSPNIIKVVFNKFNEAIYFSRSPIPFLRNTQNDQWLYDGTFYKHIGIYAYKISSLNMITKLDPTPLELSESLEQLRWIENGIIINIAVTQLDSHSVDVPDDVKVIEEIIRKNNL